MQELIGSSRFPSYLIASRYYISETIATHLSTRYYLVMITPRQIRDLINRLARLETAQTWEVGLNPSQIAALDYLARANRFSRAPSHVAEFLGTTRGTMSQTLKSLVNRGYLIERKSEIDRRSISFDLTTSGLALSGRQGILVGAIDALSASEQEHLGKSLLAILADRLSANGGRAFGVCNSCAHLQRTKDGVNCALLSVALLPLETTQICHEQVAA
jgi:DNA-binding MarR family transcriptional regulator